MQKFYKLMVFTVAMCLPLSVASAQTMEERIKSLEATVNQLQDTLTKMRAEMEKSDDKKEDGVVRTEGEEITLSTTGGGIKLKSDKGSEFQFSGRLMYDYDTYDYDDSRGLNQDGDDAEWRRTRLTAKGKVMKDWKYAFAVNIDDDDEASDVNTAYIQYNGFKPLSVTVGKFNQPFGLEQLGSSKWTSAIERSILGEEILGSFGTKKPETGGVMLSGYHKEAANMNWFLGFFDDDQKDTDGDTRYSFGARVAASPHFSDGSFLHLGLAYADQDRAVGSYQLRTRFGIHTLDRVSVTEMQAAEDASHWGLEAAYVRGPLSLQAEYMDLELDGGRWDSDGNKVVTNDDRVNADLDADGYYIQGTWTVTGESRSYKKKGAYFGEIKPSGPMGAWELVARYEDIDVENVYQQNNIVANDVNVDAAVEKWLIGVNWYANQNVKFMLNYSDYEAEGILNKDDPKEGPIDGDGDAISLRAQYAF